MSVVSCIKKSFKTIIETPVFTSFFVIFLIVFQFLLIYATNVKNPNISIILSICCFSLITAFLSGWFELAKEATNPEKFKEKKSLPIFFEGIGKNIIPVLVGTIVYSVILKAFLDLFYKLVVVNIFGSIDFVNFENLSKISQDAQATQAFFESLTQEQITALLGHSIGAFILLMSFTFLFMFYTPAIICNEKNNMFAKPFVALKDSVFFLFRNFLNSFLIYIFLFVFFIILEVTGMLFMNMTLVSLIMLLFYIYFISFTVMLLFNYYEQQNNNSDGSDCIGENESLDTTCKEAE